jgi:hypothetical protein
MASKKSIQLKHEQTTNSVDPVTGELIKYTIDKRFSIKVDSTDQFFMTFIQFMGPYYEIRYADDYKVLGKLNSMAALNTGEIVLSAQRRAELSVELKISQPQISRSIARLKELKLIFGERGTYTIASEIFWRGGTTERIPLANKQRSVTIDFDEK